MAKDRILSAIDVGSSKITTLIATLNQESDEISIIGVSTVESKGLRKGQVVNIEEASRAITESLEAAERMAGYTVSQAFVAVGGSHITSQNSHGVVAVSQPEVEISKDDINRAVDAAQAVSLPSSREIIHVIPRGFIVDGQSGILDPSGMMGIRLEVETHIISGSVTALKNLTKCVEETGVEISGLVFSGLASSHSVLSDTEKELGVVLVDIGGGTTDICIFIEGSLSHSAVLPVGAKNITNDIAIGLRVSLDSAEKIKIALSKPPKKAAFAGEEEVDIEDAKIIEEKKKKQEEFDIAHLELSEGLKTVSRKTLVDGIIRPRLDQIFEYVGLEIKRSGFGGQTPAGLVICGGGAETVGIVESCKRQLALPVRVGSPSGASGLVDEILFPQFATSLGLILYGSKLDGLKEKKLPLVGQFPGKGVLPKVLQFLKSLLP